MTVPLVIVAPVALDARFYLSGDENCGVSLYCRDCWDDGRPLAYYDTSGSKQPYTDDVLVENVTTISRLLNVATRHNREVHA